MSIYKNKNMSKFFIEPLGSLTLTGSAQTLKVINLQTFGQILDATIVISGAVITSTGAVVTWYGSSNTSGTGTLTAIAAITIASGGTTGVLQIDGEDISEAAEVADTLPNGFLSLVAKVTGVNTNTMKSALFVTPMHERVGLTPSSVQALT